MSSPNNRATNVPPDATNDQAYTTESHVRSILKALSWRIVATSTTILVAYFFTTDLKAAFSIGGVEFFAKIPIYYVHERGWQLAPRGSIRRWIRRA